MSVFSMDVSISAITVFLQGILSFISPCVLPLIPIYMGYLSGGTAVADESGNTIYDRKKVLINTLFFVIGISFAFFLLGFGVTAASKFFFKNQLIFVKLGGIIILLFGIYQLGFLGNSKILSRQFSLPFKINKLAMSPFTALIMGFLFSFAWTPCVGPALTTVLLMAASANTSANGFLLIAIYVLGFTLPFIAVGFFTTALIKFFRSHIAIVNYTEKIGGILMILTGLLMITGLINHISSFLSKL